MASTLVLSSPNVTNITTKSHNLFRISRMSDMAHYSRCAAQTLDGSSKQDVSFAEEIALGDGITFTYIGVCDGHGLHGRVCADIAATQIRHLFRTEIDKDTLQQRSDLAWIAYLEHFLCTRIDAACAAALSNEAGGSTLALAFFWTYPSGRKSKLYTANMGDSVIGTVSLSNGQVRKWSVDHSPLNESEAIRLKMFSDTESLHPMYVMRGSKQLVPIYNERCEKIERFVRDPWGNGCQPSTVDFDPSTYFCIPRTNMCLAVSRGFGDFAFRPYGFVCRPHISISEFDDHSLVFVMSDGVSDVNKMEEFPTRLLKMCQSDPHFCQTIDPSGVVNAVVTEARQGWLKHYNDPEGDDASFAMATITLQRFNLHCDEDTDLIL